MRVVLCPTCDYGCLYCRDKYGVRGVCEVGDPMVECDDFYYYHGEDATAADYTSEIPD